MIRLEVQYWYKKRGAWHDEYAQPHVTRYLFNGIPFAEFSIYESNDYNGYEKCLFQIFDRKKIELARKCRVGKNVPPNYSNIVPDSEPKVQPNYLSFFIAYHIRAGTKIFL